MKFLGMIFDDILNWNAHIKSLAKSCNRRLNLLKTLAHKEWGSDCQTLLHVYRTLIRSKLDFGCIAYGSANKTTLELLDTIHNKASRLSLGAFCTTPVESLYCSSGEPSLHNRRTYLSLAYAATVSATPTNPTHVTHSVINISSQIDQEYINLSARESVNI
ncbi:hypothetical protein JTB14_004402 [Gonioctena quinquepunctata]|nr:hypothetical protein JTB14_004402 [Gonioctena quinquepunctata]